MPKKLAMFTVLAVLGVIGAGAAVAGQPQNPGCFGQDRAANLHVMQTTGDPGASEWGHIAADRASTNGEQNRNYRDNVCNGDPS
jgi:hypothetical protein